MRKAILGALVVALALFGTVGTAAATPIYVASETGLPFRIYSPGTLAVPYADTTAGAFQITGALGVFDAYCVDLNHYISVPGTYEADPIDRMTNWSGLGGVPGAGGIAAWLYDTYAAGATTAAGKAALQLAIWDVLYDTDLNAAGGGGFWAVGDAGAMAAANVLLAAVGSNTSDATWLQLTDRSGNTQDLMGPPPVPEPGTLLLLGSGLSALALARRRKA